MVRTEPLTRRRALKTLGCAVTTGTGTAVVSGTTAAESASNGDTTETARATVTETSSHTGDAETTGERPENNTILVNEAVAPGSDVSMQARTGVFSGTVDRIEDNDHVVILVSDDGETFAQYVEPREELPSVSEGDSVGVLLFRGTLIRVWPQ